MKNNITDRELIRRYVRYAIKNGWSQTRLGNEVWRSKGWASQVVNEKITGLNFATRERIKAILKLK